MVEAGLTVMLRNSNKYTDFFALLALVVLSSCTETGDWQNAETTVAIAEPEATQRYLRQMPPGTVPELFAPGIVNTDAVELNGVFSPDFREFVFSRLIEGVGSHDGYIYPGGTRPVMFHSSGSRS